MSNRMKQAIEHVKTLKRIMSPMQLSVMGDGCRREEKEFFFDKLEEMANRFTNMHKTYEQDGKGDDAIVHLHYFRGNMDWFITEKDMEEEQIQAFGLCDLGMGGAELGYVSLEELAQAGVELDLHFTPKTLREVKAARS